MGRIWVTFFMLSWALGPVVAVADETAELSADGFRCGNERYEDFFQRQQEKERQEREREKNADDIKAVRKSHAKQLAEARKTFKRDEAVEDPRLEKAWLEEVKAEKEMAEIRRKRYVQHREESERTRCHSRKIPELKEYDLEDYY